MIGERKVKSSPIAHTERIVMMIYSGNLLSW